MPDIDPRSIIERGEEQLFACLGDGVDQKKITSDARMLNRACNVFGKDSIARAENGEYVIKGMKSTLKPHQVLGSAFMISKEKDARESKTPVSRGGILADMMGLGKTVMSLALIVRGKARDFDKLDAKIGGRSTLIVASPALVHQWNQEISIHCNINDTRCGVGEVVIYRSREWEDRLRPLNSLSKNDIILTTYEEVSKSFPLEEPPVNLTLPQRQAWWDQHFQNNKGHLHSMNFKRIILDEGHSIRNHEIRKSRACRSLVGKYKWVLSGTSLTNGVSDIWALLDFIQVSGLPTFDAFKAKYLKNTTEEKIQEFNSLLAKCMLRRSHGDRLFGAKLITLPQARQVEMQCHFTTVEREIYEVVSVAFKRRVNVMLRTHGLMYTRNNSALAMFTRLRQLVSHPLLIQGTMLELLKRHDLLKLETVIEKYQGELQDKEDGQRLLWRLRSALHNAYGRKSTKKKHRVDSATTTQEVDPEKANRDAGKAYGRRQDYDKMVKILKHSAEVVRRAAESHCKSCGNIPVDPRITECLHVYCTTCLEEIQVEAACMEERAICYAKDNIEGRNGYKTCNRRFGFSLPFNEEFSKHVVLRREESKTSGGRTKKGHLPLGIQSWLKDGGEFIASAKTKAVKAQILRWRDDYPDSKIILYTQWTMMIKILAKMCEIEEWGCVTYYGAMSQHARARAIANFEREDGIKIMICNLRCGGLGLNLTMASKVIIIDPWFNNAVEEQAFARCYRIKQTQETHLLQLVVDKTIDDRISEMKVKKQTNIDAFSNEKGFRKLSQREILSLFGEVIEDDDGNVQIRVEGDDDYSDDDDDDQAELAAALAQTEDVEDVEDVAGAEESVDAEDRVIELLD
ncbi:putative DNA repair protein RAD5 [Elsinoe fawcettii]|nr:putative DNA repair protein RAD5 [Elsinoe fawcettii]